MMMSPIEAHGIEMALGAGATRTQVLKGVSFTLSRGDVTLLMGPSGSGKSTLLSILGCILRPTSGSVRICGVTVGTLDPEVLAGIRRKHIGFVFQSYNLLSSLTAVENVRTSLAIRAYSARDAREAAASALEAVGLADRLNYLPSQMSGGEQQRVAIARAIAGNPDIVLADEPTAALDGNAGRGVMQQLQDIAFSRQCAVLVVTHDARTTAYARRILKLEDGRLCCDTACNFNGANWREGAVVNA